MVKVKEETAMAEPENAAQPSTAKNSVNNSNNNHNCYPRKPRHNIFCPNNHPISRTFHHYTYYHHHCNYPGDSPDLNGGTTSGSSPAKFYFGPGFEPQTQIPGGAFGPGPSQVQNTSEYVVLFHVNPGVTISFQIGDNLEILRGPVTVPMVSTNSSPPIAMPVQVPPGHMVQQIVDESGTLRHVILSPQHPAGLVPLASHNPQHYGAGPANGTNQPQQPFYQGLPSGYAPPHFHSNMPPGHPVQSPTHLGHSPPPNQNYYKDERTQRQYIKLKKKLHDKQQKGDITAPRKDLVNGLKRTPNLKEKGMNSVGTSEDGEESSVQDEEDSVQIIADILSSVQAPMVSELSSRSALIQWAPPTRLSEAASSDSHEVDINESDLRYEVLLSDKSKEMKFKSIYSGVNILSCRIQDLTPGQEYSVCLQVHLDELQGSATELTKFTTPPCEPDQPQPPKLITRTKNTLQLRWNGAKDNGSHILHYILEYDDGKGGEFKEFYKNRGKQHTLLKLLPATAYKFRLAAVNEVGKSPYSDVVVYRTADNPPTQPQPPTLKEVTVNSLHLQWNRRPKDDEFILQMNDPKNQYGFLIMYNGKDTQYVCNKLHCFSEYRFRLRTQNECGSQSPWSEEVSYRTLPDRPARPSKPLVKGKIHAHSFKLKWEPPYDTGGAEIYKYLLEVNSGSGYETIYSGSETEAICDKLTPGTTYQLRVCCFSSGGQSNYSDPCTVTTEAISPGQCSVPRLHGKPKSNSITIRWVEPDYNGGAPVSCYEVEMVSPDSSRSLVHKSKEPECTVSDLAPGSDYVFAVRAVNRIGPGLWSDPLKATSGAAPPISPAAPVLACKSPFHVCVEWQEPQSNGAPVTEYRLESSPVDDEQQFHLIYHGPDTSHDVKGLTPFHTYYYRVQAGNSAGFSQYSPVSATITPAAPPSPVTSLRSEVTPTSISLYWHEPNSNGAPITHYNIEIGDKLISTEEPLTEYIITSLQPDTHYKIKVQAVNSVGNGAFSSPLRTSTLRLPPKAPKLECVGVGHNYLKLKWGDGKNVDFTQYCIEMENARVNDAHCVYKGTALICKVNKLQELTTYKFRINATNDAGIGEFSKEYEFSTSIAPPAILKPVKVAEIEEHSCSIEWAPGKNLFNDPVIYQVQLSKLKEQQFKLIYKGSETKHLLENLEPGTDYSCKVCPVRITSTGELQGPYSPVTNFTTTPIEPLTLSKSSATSSNSPSHAQKNKRFQSLWQLIRPRTITDTQCIILYAMLILFIGLFISMGIVKWFL